MRRPGDRAFVQYLRDFIQTESASGVLLILAAGAALAWANVSATSYASVWATPLRVGVNDLSLEALRPESECERVKFQAARLTSAR